MVGIRGLAGRFEMDARTSPENYRNTAQPERVVSLGDVIRLMGRSWRYIAVGAVVGCVIAIALALLIPRTYRAEVVTVLAEDSVGAGGALSKLAGQFSSLAALGGVSLPGGAQRNETLALLRSREFAIGLINEYKLMPVLFASRWDAAAGKWRVSNPEDVPTLADAWEVFDKKVRTVIEDRDRGLVTVRIELRDRKLAAELANALVDQLNDALRRRKLGELDASLAFLQREYEKATLVHLRDVMSSVMESQVSERMLATSRKDYALRVVDPAVIPDLKRYVWPKPALFVALALVVGSLAGFVFSLALSYRSRP